MRHALSAAVLAFVFCAPAQAQEHFRMHTAADLARVCAPAAGDKDAAVHLAFCHGVLAGAYGYFHAFTPAADRFVCPSPTLSRAQVASGFVAWLKARPQFNTDSAVDALFRYAAEAHPCPR